MVIAAALGALSYDLSTFCTTDPPAMPTFTAADWVNIASPWNYASHTATIDKFRDALGNLLWPTLCQCTSTTTPAVPAAPTPPNTVSFPAQIPFQALPCLKIDTGYQQLTTNPLSGAGSLTLPRGATTPAQGFLLPTGYTWIDWTYEVVSSGAVHDTYDFTFRPANSPTAFSSFFVNQANVGVSTHSQNLYPGTGMGNQYYGFILVLSDHTAATTGTDLLRVTVTAYCGGQPGGAGCIACPPDPGLTALLQQILGEVTLIQRQIAPFGYIASTVHSALTGHGTIAVSDLIGVKVDIITDSATLGVSGTTPAELFERGWVTFSTADGATHSERIDHDPQLILPLNAGVYTSIQYDLNPLITVSITELVREP